MAETWPRLKKGNPYRHTFTFGYASGSLTDVVATLMIKRYASDTDANALLVADSDAIGGLTLSAGASPNTGVIEIDLPDEDTGALPAGKLLFIGLQLLLPNGDTFEFDADVLECRIRVEGDVVHATA